MNIKKAFIIAVSIVVYGVSTCHAMENKNNKPQEEMKPLDGRLRRHLVKTKEEIKESNRKRQQNHRANMSTKEKETANMKRRERRAEKKREDEEMNEAFRIELPLDIVNDIDVEPFPELGLKIVPP